ncbi:hypothetical protein [Halomicrobium salinisoli]|uniref:hypothetical protein n=1 Tax=Halomicrobium salinisoli TaxID=2878391 RepID=UPI001CF017EF|nr:hypothetical protein [Halomicrobium salinisoli]
MRPTGPEMPPTPRGRNRYLKAYARFVRTLLGVLTLTFLLSRKAAQRTVLNLIELHPRPPRDIDAEVDTVSTAFNLDFVGPTYDAYPEFLLSRLTYEPIAAVLVCGLAAALVLEVHGRR